MNTLIDAERIQQEVERLGRRISADYEGRPLTVLGVLTGSIVFLSDLIRQIEVPHRVGLLQASSYRGRETRPDELSIDTSLLPDVRERDVLLVDDIFDTGHTLEALLAILRSHQPRSVRSAVLLVKQDRREVEVAPDYQCFEIPDRFVVGYGLDYDDDYRHLPWVAALDDEDL